MISIEFQYQFEEAFTSIKGIGKFSTYVLLGEWKDRFSKTKFDRNQTIFICEKFENFLEIYKQQLQQQRPESWKELFEEVECVWKRWRCYYILLSQDSLQLGHDDS